MLEEFAKFYKLVITILKPIEQSTFLLERIDAKLDAQATSKVKGQFRSIQRLYEKGTLDNSALSNCLSSLTESCEYFKIMAGHTLKILQKEDKKDLYSFWQDCATFRFLFKGPKWVKNNLQNVTEFQTYINLILLSKIGIVVCMHALMYPLSSIAKEYSFKIEDIFGDEDLLNYGGVWSVQQLNNAVCAFVAHEHLIPDDLIPAFSIYKYNRSDNLLFGLRRAENKEMIKNFARARVLEVRIRIILNRHQIDQKSNNFDINALINDIIDSKNLLNC